MSDTVDRLIAAIQNALAERVSACTHAYGEVTLEVEPDRLVAVCEVLRDDPSLAFEQLVDLCGVDYLLYGRDEWDTEDSSATGFSRGVEEDSSGRLQFGDELDVTAVPRRFAVVVHLLSYRLNHRLRVRCYAPDGDLPVVPSLTGVWASADWFEREAFDLFGILFQGHSDLRRILTDYGFVGHPFRKDFPLVGNVETRYDPERRRVVYEPVSITPRVLVPRVIRDDSRYQDDAASEPENDG